MPWSALPKDLLLSISNRLDTRFDIRKLRAVCSPWRLSVPPPPPSPSFPIYNGGWIQDDQKLSEIIVYCLEEYTTRKQWLVRLTETEDGNVQIKDVFGRSLKTPLDYSKVINSLNYQVSEITKLYHAYDMIFYDNDDDDDIHGPIRVDLPSKPLTVDPSVSYPIVATVVDDGDHEMLRESVIFNGRVTAFSHSKIVEFEGKLYVVNNGDDEGDVMVCDYLLEISATIYIPGFFPPGNNSYDLVSFRGDLFLVDKADVPACEFSFWINEIRQNGRFPNFKGYWFNSDKYIKLYKLDEEKQKWVEVTNLGDGALILCKDHSFGVSVEEFSGIVKGFVYFLCSDPLNRRANVVWGFNIEDGTLCRCLDRLNIPQSEEI